MGGFLILFFCNCPRCKFFYLRAIRELLLVPTVRVFYNIRTPRSARLCKKGRRSEQIYGRCFVLFLCEAFRIAGIKRSVLTPGYLRTARTLMRFCSFKVNKVLQKPSRLTLEKFLRFKSRHVLENYTNLCLTLNLHKQIYK